MLNAKSPYSKIVLFKNLFGFMEISNFNHIKIHDYV